jgi:quercetin dioxygenase-like cupin family protein
MTQTDAEIMSPTAQLIRDRDLEPSWVLKRAREDGFRRSLTTWVGGPKGYVNTHVAQSARSSVIAGGLMRMAVGNRQPGVHVHSVTEIYVILKGEVESYDGMGRTHRAGPYDCLYIPAGVPHAVRAIGDEDLELIWIHDGIERHDVSVYLEGDGPFPSEREVVLIPYRDLRPGQPLPGGADRGAWSVNWVAGPAGMVNFNPGIAEPNPIIAMGMTAVPPGQSLAPHNHGGGALGIVLQGAGTVSLANGTEQVTVLDAVYCPANDLTGIRNTTSQPLYIMWVDEKPE